jgi:hypothetical protein
MQCLFNDAVICSGNKESIREEKTSMEHWWNDTDKGKQKYWEKNLPQCHFAHHKFHTDKSWMELGRPMWKTGD